MTRDEILRAIAETARRELGHEGEIGAGTRLVEDLDLDSLRLLALAVAVENRFRVCLEPEDEAAIETVGDLATLIQAKLAAGAADEVGG